VSDFNPVAIGAAAVNGGFVAYNPTAAPAPNSALLLDIGVTRPPDCLEVISRNKILKDS
jgi:hypothetical protein